MVISTVCCKLTLSIFSFKNANFGMSSLTVINVAIFCHTFFIDMSEITLFTIFAISKFIIYASFLIRFEELRKDVLTA